MINAIFFIVGCIVGGSVSFVFWAIFKSRKHEHVEDTVLYGVEDTVLYGRCVQYGTPTPDNPIPIVLVTEEMD